MKNSSSRIAAQRGAITIFICMVILLFMTLMVVTAFSMSTVNLQSVGNAQTRNEAQSAAQSVIEQVVTSPFTDDPAGAVLNGFGVDMNGDGQADYLVDLLQPSCVRATQANVAVGVSVTLPGMSAVDAWNTVWELDATAIDPATGTRVRVKQGVRKLLSESQKNLRCPT